MHIQQSSSNSCYCNRTTVVSILRTFKFNFISISHEQIGIQKVKNLEVYKWLGIWPSAKQDKLSNYRSLRIEKLEGNDHILTLYHRITTIITTLDKRPFENIVGRGENAGNQNFLLFPQCFLFFLKKEVIISPILNL